MQKSRQHSMESFVARFWLEQGEKGRPRWRGHIRHVQDGREIYFLDLREMQEFLEEVSGIPGPCHSSEACRT